MRNRVIEPQALQSEVTGSKRHPYFVVLADNLSTLRLLPHFFPDTLPAKTDILDSSAVIASLRGITYAISKQLNSCHSSRLTSVTPGAVPAICDDCDSATCIGCRSMVGVLFSLAITHGSPPSRTSDGTDTSLTAPWCGIAIGASFYLSAVVRQWNTGLPIEPKLFARLIRMHMLEMKMSEESMLNRGEGRDIWLWLSFVAAYILRSGQAWTNRERQALDQSIQSGMFDQHLRNWSLATGIVNWDDARTSLHKIVWPDIPSVEEKARKIWEDIVL